MRVIIACHGVIEMSFVQFSLHLKTLIPHHPTETKHHALYSYNLSITIPFPIKLILSKLQTAENISEH